MLLFVLIFLSQSAFALPGLSSGIITGFLCSGTTAAVNQASVQSRTSAGRKAEIQTQLKSRFLEKFSNDEIALLINWKVTMTVTSQIRYS